MIVRRIGPLSCAKMAGTLYALISLPIGAVFSLIALMGGFSSRSYSGGGIAASVGIGAFIAFPIIYGLFGFVTTLIAAWLYNVLARLVGGIQIEIE